MPAAGYAQRLKGIPLLSVLLVEAWLIWVVSNMTGCETRVVAIAFDGAFPDSNADGRAGQQRKETFARQTGRYSVRSAGLTQADGLANPELTGEPIALAKSGAVTNELRPPARDESADIDTQQVKESFTYLAADAQNAIEYFYARLFANSPETQAMFPLAMSQQRERFFMALSRLVAGLDASEASSAYLRELGRDHRKFGVKDKHYAAFFDALLATVQHCAGRAWTPETAKGWRGAVEYASVTMRAAAAADAETRPAWWVGEIVAHERRTPSAAVLTIRPDQPLAYLAGQYVPVQVTRWPRVWRSFSIANAPRASGLIDLHVRAVAGGLVSNALVHHVDVGDTLLLGAASGTMTPPGSDRDMLCVAGGTGLAPIKAIIEAILSAPAGRPRKITLFVGARQEDDLYDLPALQSLAAAHPFLRVTPVLSEQPGFGGLCGLLPEVVRGHGLFDDAEVYICGPGPMVVQTALALSGQVPAERIHHDPVQAAQDAPAGSAAGWTPPDEDQLASGSPASRSPASGSRAGGPGTRSPEVGCPEVGCPAPAAPAVPGGLLAAGNGGHHAAGGQDWERADGVSVLARGPMT